MVRIRRARALLVTFGSAGAVALHFFTRSEAPLDGAALSLLASLDDWTDPEAMFAAHAPEARARLATELLRLVDLGLLLIEGTEAAALDARLERAWEWGPKAGAFHFGLRGTSYVEPGAVAQWMEARLATTPPVPLCAEHGPGAVPLPPPSPDHPLLSAMRARRSRRGFGDAPLPLEALRDCLFAATAIVGFGESDTPGALRLPITLSPSGGARNPYEAYVVARAVAGLAPGIYHYAGIDNSLAPLGSADLPSLPALLGGQAWFERAGALILLVANFRRTMWKYPHFGGLRVVLIEAGHIAQNVLLCAAFHGLAAAPTCALSDEAIERTLGLDPVTQAPMYAVALGTPSGAPSEADFTRYAENPALPGWLGDPARGDGGGAAS